MAGSFTLVGGGVRSGKSRFAHDLALERGARRVFVATGEARDDEMRARIEAHQHERGDGFRTVEAPRQLVEALEALNHVDVVLIDCLTLWISNLLLDGADERTLANEVERLATHLTERTRHVLLVSNEVGMGIVPENALSRRFRDAVGRAHQTLGAMADEVYFAALGQILRLKPGPVQPATL